MNKTKLTFFALSMAMMVACSSEDDTPSPVEEVPEEEEEENTPPEESPFQNWESDWIGILGIAEDNTLHRLDFEGGEMLALDVAPMVEGSNNYVSTSGRYITSIERAENKVRFFDTGIESHGDHGHQRPARWLDATVEAPAPTHYSASHGNIVIFNDGDASVAIIRESDMTPRMISTEQTPNHGAATWLKGNKLAVSYRDDNLEGTLPQMVKILDAEGNVLIDNEAVRVSGIHGDASNGSFGAFGAIEGIIIASEHDEIKLIPNIEPLGEGSGNWMGTVKGHDNIDVFYGYARNHGIFMIDPVNETMTQVHEGGGLVNYFLSANGSHLIVHTGDNELVVYNASSGARITGAAVSMAVDQNLNARLRKASGLEVYRLMEEENPIISSSEDYLYVLTPNRQAIDVLDISTLEEVHTFEFDSKLKNIMTIGYHE